MSDTPSYDPTPQPSSSAKGLPPALANLSDATLQWIQVGGGLLAFISTFLPWYSIRFSSFGFSVGGSDNGLENGFWGVLTLLLGLAVAALAFIKVRNIQIQGLNLPSILPLVLAGLLALFVVIRWIMILSGSVSAEGVSLNDLEEAGVDVSSGVGIWLALIGSLAALGASLLPVLKNRNA